MVCGFVLLACFSWLVWLLCACGVRRLYDLRRVCLYFSLLCLSFCPFVLLFVYLSALVVLCSLCVLVALYGCVVVSFSLSVYTQKKGRAVLVRPLLSCCVCSDSCTVIEKLPRCVFGFFQFVRLILPCVGCYPVTTIRPASTLYSIPATL